MKGEENPSLFQWRAGSIKIKAKTYKKSKDHGGFEVSQEAEKCSTQTTLCFLLFWSPLALCTVTTTAATLLDVHMYLDENDTEFFQSYKNLVQFTSI